MLFRVEIILYIYSFTDAFIATVLHVDELTYD